MESADGRGLLVTSIKHPLQMAVPPNIPMDTIYLEVTRTGITTVRSNDFQDCFNLTMLDLSQNKLRRIEKNSFRDLELLEYLYLDRNYLHFDRISFPPYLLAPLSHLHALKMHNQNYQRDEDYIFTDFKKIMSEFPVDLEEIHVDIPWYPCDDSYVSAFSRFVYLVQIDLYRSRLCPTVIKNDTFRPLENLPLINFHLHFDRLMQVEPLAFSWLTELTHLDMNGTYGISVADFYPALFGLRRTKIEVLILSHFHQRKVKPDPVTLNSTFFRHLQLPHLRMLSLENTDIRSTRDWIFPENMDNLRYICLANNQI